MKIIMTLGSVVVLMGSPCWSDSTVPNSGANNGSVNQPCKQIEQACTSAGYVRGEGAQGKGLVKNCVHPIIMGQTVKGVSVDPSVVAACKQRMSKQHGKKKAAQNGGNANGNPVSNPGSGANGDSDGSSAQ